jgi:hypothetical protein
MYALQQQETTKWLEMVEAERKGWGRGDPAESI